MAYIDKNLLPGEEVLFQTRKHLIIFIYPLIILIVAIYGSQFLQTSIFPMAAWIPSVIAIVYFLSVWLEYVTSFFTVTNRRVLMREGFFYRHANEVRIETISQVNIDQGLMGQILNYGTVSINTFGAFDAYSIIAHPYEFRRAVNEQLDKRTK